MKYFINIIYFLSTILLFPIHSKAQLFKSKKNGYVICYLDSTLKPTKKEFSYYYGYEYYDNGKAILTFKKFYLNSKKNKIISKPDSQVVLKMGEPILLSNISFGWKNKLGYFTKTEKYFEGKPLYMEHWFYDVDDETIEYKAKYYFTNKYNNQEGSFYYEEIVNDTLLYKANYYKNKKWGFYNREYTRPYEKYFWEPHFNFGYSYTGKNLIELGYSQHLIFGKYFRDLEKTTDDDSHISGNISILTNFKRNNFIIAPKIGIKGSYYIFGGGIDYVRYYLKNNNRINCMRYSIGFSARGMLNIFYTYNYFISGNENLGINNHGFTITIY